MGARKSDRETNYSAIPDDGAPGREDDGGRVIEADGNNRGKTSKKNEKNQKKKTNKRVQQRRHGMGLEDAQSMTGRQSALASNTEPSKAPPVQEIVGPELTDDLLQSLANDRETSRIYGKTIRHDAWKPSKDPQGVCSDRAGDPPNDFAFFTELLSARGGHYQANGW